MYYNQNGYLSLSSFDSLGFSSISKINNYEACTKYILKYINKDMCSSFKGQHLYFCSKGLKRSESILKFISSDIQPISFDFQNSFCNKKELDYNNLKIYLDTLIDNGKIYLIDKDLIGYLSIYY